MVVAAYLQYIRDIQPCLLCMVQRVIVIALAIVFLIASLHRHNNASKRGYNTVNIMLIILGLLSSLRQVWLQHLPPSTQSYCVPGYSFLIKTAAWKTLVKYLLVGTPECSHIEWTLMGLSAAEWSVVFFALFGFVVLWQMLRKH